mmetsp:Transcript_18262/g.41662  ORF Transcript_18262/g.41662 Transcript_18262/m.41662 type:complete len:213 (-) Transcript_18262:2178-2816(-)
MGNAPTDGRHRSNDDDTVQDDDDTARYTDDEDDSHHHHDSSRRGSSRRGDSSTKKSSSSGGGKGVGSTSLGGVSPRGSGGDVDNDSRRRSPRGSSGRGKGQGQGVEGAISSFFFDLCQNPVSGLFTGEDGEVGGGKGDRGRESERDREKKRHDASSDYDVHSEYSDEDAYGSRRRRAHYDDDESTIESLRDSTKKKTFGRRECHVHLNFRST